MGANGMRIGEVTRRSGVSRKALRLLVLAAVVLEGAVAAAGSDPF